MIDAGAMMTFNKKIEELRPNKKGARSFKDWRKQFANEAKRKDIDLRSATALEMALV